jgi:hypothetical protein
MYSSKRFQRIYQQITGESQRCRQIRRRGRAQLPRHDINDYAPDDRQDMWIPLRDSLIQSEDVALDDPQTGGNDRRLNDYVAPERPRCSKKVS